jgi:predicted DNA-binding transcriptional regulator AlpA
MPKSTKGKSNSPDKKNAFPRPVKIGYGKFARNFFRYGEAVHFIDGRAGDPPRKLSEADRVRLISAREFRHLLGDVSEMFLWRLLNKDRAAA